MPKELIAPAPGQVAFREYESPPLEAHQVRVRSLYDAAKHGTEMALYKGYANPRGTFDRECQVFMPDKPMFTYPVPLGTMCGRLG